MHGVQHQELVSARFGKKRGPFAGVIGSVGRDYVEVTPEVSLKPGDGVVFDTGGDTNEEQGGRIFEVKGKRLFFQHGRIDFAALRPRAGHRNLVKQCELHVGSLQQRAAAFRPDRHRTIPRQGPVLSKAKPVR